MGLDEALSYFSRALRLKLLLELPLINFGACFFHFASIGIDLAVESFVTRSCGVGLLGSSVQLVLDLLLQFLHPLLIPLNLHSSP